MAHIILFEDVNFQGKHTHVYGLEPNLNNDEDDSYNDIASSLVVVGQEVGPQNWITYDNAVYGSAFPAVLGPGLYPWVEAVGITNDRISSLAPTDMDPNVRATPLDNHILLFEHANFHGKHKHVFTTESDVTADSEFSGILHNPNTSSLAVLKGNWAFYSRPGLDPQTKYPPTLGPGGYPFVGDVQIADNELSSLQPVVDRPTVQPPPIPVVDQGVVLFQYQKFHGKHKHVVAMEPNLNADDDADFNDSGTQSFVIRDRQWIFYPDWNFQGSYPIGYRSPGEYDLPEEAGSISSLAPLV